MSLNQLDISKIIIMRGLGYHHSEIADTLDVSIKTVQNHLNNLKEQADEATKNNDLYSFYWKKVLGVSAISLIRNIINLK